MTQHESKSDRQPDQPGERTREKRKTGPYLIPGRGPKRPAFRSLAYVLSTRQSNASPRPSWHKHEGLSIGICHDLYRFLVGACAQVRNGSTIGLVLVDETVSSFEFLALVSFLHRAGKLANTAFVHRQGHHFTVLNGTTFEHIEMYTSDGMVGLLDACTLLYRRFVKQASERVA